MVGSCLNEACDKNLWQIYAFEAFIAKLTTRVTWFAVWLAKQTF